MTTTPPPPKSFNYLSFPRRQTLHIGLIRSEMVSGSRVTLETLWNMSELQPALGVLRGSLQFLVAVMENSFGPDDASLGTSCIQLQPVNQSGCWQNFQRNHKCHPSPGRSHIHNHTFMKVSIQVLDKVEARNQAIYVFRCKFPFSIYGWFGFWWNQSHYIRVLRWTSEICKTTQPK